MGDDANGDPSASERDDLARRQAALRALAQSATQQPTSTPDAPIAAAPAPPEPQRATTTTTTATRATGGRSRASFSTLVTGQRKANRRRGVIVGVSLALIVVVVTVGIIGVRAYLEQRAAAQPKPVLRINPLGDSNLGCLSALAWSPDGSQIAALGGLQGKCGPASTDTPTDAIFIYNALSGKLITQLQPDRVILDSTIFKQFAATNNEAGAQTNVYVQGLTWTRDQQALLMSFGVSLQLPEGQNGVEPGVFGVMRLGIRDATLTKLWSDQASNTFQNGMLPRWDLTTGKLSAVPPPAAGATLFRWTSDGVLIADGSAAGKPIGSPSADQTFSMWQPGFLAMAQRSDTGNSPPAMIPQDIEFGANFASLSPDGRYFYQYFPAYGSLVPPSTRHPFPHEAQITPHDTALVALARRLSVAPQTTSQPVQYLVAWRPDGRLLATVTQNDSGSLADANFTVTLYDTRTGQVVSRLTPSLTGLQSGDSGQEMLSWSPDGKHLALADNMFGAITIWGPGALPA
jgi:WD40 repeat protein